MSAIEVGPSFNQYTDRLIDAKAQIDEKISVVPEGALKTEILNSVSAFLDARELWRLAIAYQDVHEYLIWACDLYVKYNLRVDGSSSQDSWCRELSGIYQKVPIRSSWSGFDVRRRFLDSPLSEIWKVAMLHLNKTEEEFRASR